MNDLISRQAAIDAVCMEWCNVKHQDCKHPLDENDNYYWCDGCETVLRTLPSIQSEPRWIPCSERLPEEDVEVLISYRYKDGEGDTSHAYIDITTYGQMYFGGNKVGDHKHWRAPFEYFESNYEVIAWMPLPEPYKGGEE